MGLKNNKCCCGCDLGSDDFNRADSTDVGSNWEQVSGDWEIDTEELVNVSAGPLATTVCHPATYPLGSFVATFKAVNVADGMTYKIRAGNPSTSPYEVSIVVAGTKGAGGTVTFTVTGDETSEWVFEWHDQDDDYMDLAMCYAPGLMLSIAWNNRVPQITEPGRLDACIDGVAAASNCFTIGGVEVGNFSFLEGEFDDWEYSVHWIENRSCDRCACFCYENDGTTETFSCPPATLYLNLTNEAFCEGIEGSYALKQRYVDIFGAGGDDLTPPDSMAWPEKVQWATDPITCPTSDVKVMFVLRCSLLDLTYPKWTLWCIVTLESLGAVFNTFGFDPTDANTVTPRTCDNNAGTIQTTVSEATAKEGSGCDPLYLEFPDVLETVCGCSEGNNDYTCCDIFCDEGTDQPGPAIMGCTVTE